MVAKLGKFLFTGLFLLFLLMPAFSQVDNFFVVSGRLTTDDGRVDGATITITKNGSSSETITPPKTGRFRFEFDFNNEYELIFQKKGFFKKIIIVSSHVPSKVMEKDNRFPPLTFMVNLFQELPGIDKSFTNKPVGRVYYNAEIDNFDTEVFFSDIQIEETIDEAISQNEGLSREERDIKRAREQELAALEKDYDKAIKEADVFYQQKKFEEALAKYQYASNLFSDRPYPRDRVAELGDLIAANQLAAQSQRELLAQYQSAIDQGDAAFSTAKYTQAQQYYESALQLKPNDEYAVSQIREIAVKVKEQELNQQFDGLITQADQLYQSGNLEEAREKYVKAASLKPDQASYPEEQIRKIDQELIAQQELVERERQYEEAIREGDAATTQRDYNAALVAFRKALSLKENDELARRKIEDTEQTIIQQKKQDAYDKFIAQADQAFNAGNLQRAKSFYKEALTQLPDEVYPRTKIDVIDQLVERESQFNRLMAQAKDAFDAGNLDQSKLLYQQAQQIKDEVEISQRIAEIDQLLAQREVDNNYQSVIDVADRLLANNQLEEAKTNYNEAITIKPNEQYPKDKIQQIDQELARLADLAEKQRQYQNAMTQGNTAFGQEQYQSALAFYQTALTFKENDELAIEKIRETESMIQAQENKRNYDDRLALADQEFQSENWVRAKLLYEEALGFLPNENYPKQQITQIDQIIAQNNQFDQLMSQAQDAFGAENYLESKEFYQQAFAIKNEQSIQDRINEIDQILAQQELDKNYNELLATADDAYRSEQFEQAKTTYGQALELKPAESYPKTQIQLIDQELARLAALAELEEQYAQAMQSGANYEGLENYEEALSSYRLALSIKNGDAAAQAKVNEVQARIEQLNLQNRYQTTIAEADQRFNAEDYNNANELYRQALTYLPNEVYPQNQIERIAEILREREEQRKLDEDYQQTIARADEAFQNEQYQEAKAAYGEAALLKPDQNYPNDRIRQIDDILAEQARLAQLEREFNAAKEKADAAFNAEDYQLSRGFYQTALNLKPDAPEVSARIAEIDRILQQIEEERLREEERQRAQAEARDKAYQDAMEKGNTLLANQKFDQARESFRLAKETKPEEFLPDEMIAKADSLQAEHERLLAEERAREQARQQALLAEKDDAYNNAIQEGDRLYEAKDYELAKIQYETAVSVKPEEEYPKRRIADIEGEIARIARLTTSYNKAIEDANRFVQLNEYLQARSKYEEALQYLPDEEYPKRQIERLNEILAQQEQERILEENYLASIQSADSLFSLNELQLAKENYQVAAGLKPAERYPKERIQQIDMRLAELAREQARVEAIETAYQEAIQKGDAAFAELNYNLAKVAYNEAIALKPEETYPRDQINRIEGLIAQQAEEAYQNAIAKADGFFNNEEYEDARTSYQEALKIKENDSYASSQIALINQRLAELARAEMEQQELDRSYQEKMNLAEAAFNNSQYQNAKNNYQLALNLKPQELLPAQQIAKIDSILAELERQEEINQQYTQAINDGQNAFRQNQLQEAISFYQRAADLKPEETFPPQRISEIRDIIAQQEEIERLAQQEEEQRLARLRAEQEQYDAAIIKADQSFNDKKYAEAKQFYNDALGIRPDEIYPKNRILEIDNLIETLTQEEMSRKQQAYLDSLRSAQNKAFDLKVAQADGFFEQTSYQQAISTYQDAIQLLPERSGEVTPKIEDAEDQLRIIREQQANYDRAIVLADQYYDNEDFNNALTAYQEALNYKPDENYPKERIRSIQQSMKAIEDSYAETIRSADEFFAAEDWFNAKDKYTEALNIKANEQYPADQIALANQKIKEQQDALKAQQLSDESYRQTIAKGEEAFLNDQLTAALTHFEFAKELKPEETYPDEKIAEINELIAKREQDAELARQQRLIDDRYRQAISVADNSFRQEQYVVAKGQYNQALSIKPEEDYPKGQIELINRLLSEQQANVVIMKEPVVTSTPSYTPEVKTSIPKVNYSVSKKESDYDVNIRFADDAYRQRDYVVAQFYYRKASGYEPEKKYPRDRIEEIAKLIDQSMKASELAAYQEAIRKADDAFIGKRYSIAKFYYYKGLEIKSWEQYPKDRIEEITKLTNTMLSEREEQAYRDFISKGDDAYFKKELAVARSYYQQALGIKKDERYPKIKLVDIEKLVEQDLRDEENRIYRKIISEGDKAMLSKNFAIARFYYNKALGVKPNDKYPKEQLEKIKQLVSSKNK